MKVTELAGSRDKDKGGVRSTVGPISEMECCNQISRDAVGSSPC